jgi:hypothetical protein
LNRWECEVEGCDSIADGLGGALGLMAIGWYFKVGPVIRCPRHNPYGYDASVRAAILFQDGLKSMVLALDRDATERPV